MFNYFNKFAICYAYFALIFNKCSIEFRISNIGTPFIKTSLYSHDYGKIHNNLLDSIPYDTNYTSTKSVKVDVVDDNQPRYNKHPRFCFGNYRIFNVDILNDFMWKCGKLEKTFISYIDLLTKCNIKIEEFGNYSISYRGDSDDEYNKHDGAGSRLKAPVISSLNTGFSDKSLSKLRRIFGKNDSDNASEFIEGLKHEPIGTYLVEDLISDVPVRSCSRADLLKFLENTVINGSAPISIHSLTPISWEYFPATHAVRISMFLNDLNRCLYLCFGLHPGTKPLVIDNGLLKIESNPDDTNVTDPKDSGYKKKPFKYVHIAFVKVRHITDDSMKKLVKHDPSNHKSKVISIYGSSRSRFNRMFNLMQMLSNNLEVTAEPGAKLSKRPDLNFVLDTTSPIQFKMVSVRANSQFKFLIPLVTYVDFRDGNAYLCNSSIPIEAKPLRVWPLSNGTYAQYNMRFVPECYKNAGFFSNLDMEFNPEDILKILSSYREFKKLIFENKSSGETQSPSEFPNDALTFERELPLNSPENVREVKVDKNSNDADKSADFNVYYVNGTNKMIYKCSDGAILVNLLV